MTPQEERQVNRRRALEYAKEHIGSKIIAGAKRQTEAKILEVARKFYDFLEETNDDPKSQATSKQQALIEDYQHYREENLISRYIEPKHLTQEGAKKLIDQIIVNTPDFIATRQKDIQKKVAEKVENPRT